MVIFPAIDIKDGKCVRLTRGDYATAAKVADSYMATALNFANAGAEWIHMVDLDGAKEAKPLNARIFTDVAKNTPLKVQAGGGIRALGAIEEYLSNGISRVILGSAAVKDPALVRTAVREYGRERIAVGIDARNGFVATGGWLETSAVGYIELALKMCEAGVKYYIFTDIDKDGTLSRPNHAKTKLLQEKVSALGGYVIASGGIKTLANIKTLKKNGVFGAICGKSLYTGTLDLAKAIKAAAD